MTNLHPKQLKEIKRKRRRLFMRDIDKVRSRFCFGAHGKPNKRKRGFRVPWHRDGHESELHYLVKHKSRGMHYALQHDFKDHPLYTAALEAKKLKLI